MSASRESVKTIFGQALVIGSHDERARYLDQACAGDDSLRAEVDDLLGAIERAGNFLCGSAPSDDTFDRSPLEQPGTQIGPYKLLEQIGEGGMGVVYMAEQQEPVRRKVALKVIKPGMDTRQVVARFEAEQQALAMMEHPNIAKVLDAGTTGEKGVRNLLPERPGGCFAQKVPDPFFADPFFTGRPYFVMELVNGIPVTQFCDEQHLTARQRLELFIPICQAVQHAHQKGIIHRDIKPSNVLVALYDGRPVPKVIDFGVAKAVSQPLTEKTLFTRLGQIIGTFEYMSPEQAQRNQLDVDTRSDVYSLGVLLYELLTGDTPFDKQRLQAAAFDELMRIIREEEPPKPSTKVSSGDTQPSVAMNRGIELSKLSALIRGELDWIVMKALEKDRNRRYESAGSFAADVAHYLQDEPVLACPPSASYRLRKFARRNKAALAVAGLILSFLVLSGSGIGWTIRDRAARQARVSEQVGLILDEVARLEQQQQWPEALVAAQRAEAVLASGEAPQGVRAMVPQVISDLKLVARLEEIRLLASGATERGFDYAGADQQYAAALREYGIDVDALPAEEAIRSLQSRAEVLPALIIALDDWAACRREAENEATAKPLAELARALDTNPWRRRKRDVLAHGSEQELQELIGSEEVAHQPASTIELLAGELFFRGKSEDALQILERALSEHPDDFWLHTTAARVHGGSSSSPRYDEAIRHYTAALALRPRSASVHSDLGTIFNKLGRLDEAIACYRRAIGLHPKFAPAHNNLGNALKDQGRLDEAIACYRQAIELNPKLAMAHANLGLALRIQGQLGEALGCCRRAVELDPEYAKGHDYLGVVLMDQKQFDEAIASFRRAIELNPKVATSHSNLGAALATQGKPDEAIACWRRACELDPQHAVAHDNLGIALQMQGKLEEAMTSWRRAIACYRQAGEDNPKLAPACNSLAWLLATADDSQLRNPAEAVQLARVAVQLEPKSWEYWDTLSVAAFRAGDWKTSLEARQEKLQRHPIATDDRLFLAMTHWQLGDKAAARQSYNEATTEIANDTSASESTSGLRQEAEQLLGIDTSPTPPEGVKPTGKEPLP